MMTEMTTLKTVMPMVQVLGQCLERSSFNYLERLQHNADDLGLCREAGKSFRTLAHCLTQVICASLDYIPDLNEEEDDDEELNWEDSGVDD